MIITNSNRILPDALERDFSNNAHQGNKPLSLKQGIFKVAKVIGSAAKATGVFMGNALTAQAEARARAMGYGDLLKRDF